MKLQVPFKINKTKMPLFFKLNSALKNLKCFLNCVGYTQSKGRMTVNYELERMWKEVTVPYFKILSQSGGTKENPRLKFEAIMIAVRSWSFYLCCK